MSPEVYFLEGGPSSWYMLRLQHQGPFRVDTRVRASKCFQTDVQKGAQVAFWTGGQGPAACWTFARKAA